MSENKENYDERAAQIEQLRKKMETLNVPGAVSKSAHFQDVAYWELERSIKEEMPKTAKLGDAWLIHNVLGLTEPFFVVSFLTTTGVRFFIGSLIDKRGKFIAMSEGSEELEKMEKWYFNESADYDWDLEACIKKLRRTDKELAKISPSTESEQAAMDLYFALRKLGEPVHASTETTAPVVDKKVAAENDPLTMVEAVLKKCQAVSGKPIAFINQPLFPQELRAVDFAIKYGNPRLTQLLFGYGMTPDNWYLDKAKQEFHGQFPQPHEITRRRQDLAAVALDARIYSDAELKTHNDIFVNYQLILSKYLETKLKAQKDRRDIGWVDYISMMLEANQKRAQYLQTLNQNPDTDPLLQAHRKFIVEILLRNKDKVESPGALESLVTSAIYYQDTELYKILIQDKSPFRTLEPGAFVRKVQNQSVTSGGHKTILEFTLLRGTPAMIQAAFNKDNINKAMQLGGEQSPLLFALENQEYSAVILLLGIPGMTIPEKDKYGQTIVSLIEKARKDVEEYIKNIGDYGRSDPLLPALQADLERRKTALTGIVHNFVGKFVKEYLDATQKPDFQIWMQQAAAEVAAIVSLDLVSATNQKNSEVAKAQLELAALTTIWKIMLRSAPDMSGMSFKPETEKPEELGLAEEGRGAPSSEIKDRKDQQEVLFQAQMAKEIKGRQPFIEALKNYKGEKAILQAEPFSEARRQKIENDIPEKVLWLSLDPSVNQASLNSFHISYKLPDMPAQHLEASLSSSGYTVTLPDKAKTVVTEKDFETFLGRVYTSIFSPSIKLPLS